MKTLKQGDLILQKVSKETKLEGSVPHTDFILESFSGFSKHQIRIESNILRSRILNHKGWRKHAPDCNFGIAIYSLKTGRLVSAISSRWNN